MNRFALPLAAAAAVALSVAGFTASHLALGNLAPASAQSAPGPQGGPGAPGGRRGNARFTKMLQSLGLSDDQKSQIRTIMSDARTAGQSLTDPQAKRDNMRAAMAKVDAVLTPDQRAKLKAQRDAARAQHAGDAPRGGDAPRT